MYRVALRILQHEQTRKDALQDSLWLVFSRLRTLQQQTRFFQWLYQITQRTAISRSRRRKPRISLDTLMSDRGLDPQDSLPVPTKLCTKMNAVARADNRVGVEKLEEFLRLVEGVDVPHRGIPASVANRPPVGQESDVRAVGSRSAVSDREVAHRLASCNVPHIHFLFLCWVSAASEE